MYSNVRQQRYILASTRQTVDKVIQQGHNAHLWRSGRKGICTVVVRAFLLVQCLYRTSTTTALHSISPCRATLLLVVSIVAALAEKGYTYLDYARHSSLVQDVIALRQCLRLYYRHQGPLRRLVQRFDSCSYVYILLIGSRSKHGEISKAELPSGTTFTSAWYDRWWHRRSLHHS